MNSRLPKLFSKVSLVTATLIGVLLGLVYLPGLSASGGSQAVNHSSPILAAPTATKKPEIYLPVVQKSPSFVDHAWVADKLGSVVGQLNLRDPIQYSVRGTNNTGKPVDVQIKWTLSGPCSSGRVYTDTLRVGLGVWTSTIKTTAPDCAGEFSLALEVKYLDQTVTHRVKFVVYDPSLITISNQPAFDKCDAPPLTDLSPESKTGLQHWWDESPYYSLNIYIGGISRYCSNTRLTKDWVAGAAKQGWAFIPTWVGPQAPCSRWTHKMTGIKSLAYAEGQDEAEEAVKVARSLGLLDGSPIYYDLENYSASGSMTLDRCREIVKEFMRGWTDKLHELKMKSGIYGSPCSSYLPDFNSLTSKPDDIWIAWWTEEFYTEGISVWNSPCGLSNDMWANHQRLRQYAGGHTEVWGGVKYSIDSDIADGEVAVLPRLTLKPSPTPTSTVTSTVTTTVAPEAFTTPVTSISSFSPEQIRSFGLLSADTGWATAQGRLLWTVDGGAVWQDLTPQSLEGEVLNALFIDEQHGWLAARDTDNGLLSILYTSDGGMTWAASSLPESTGIDTVSLQFVDNLNGWAVVKLATSIAFNQGRLYRTTDGGVTWEASELPSGEGAFFTDKLQGWAWGGLDGAELFLTFDGGKTWLPQPAGSQPPADLQAAAANQAALPEGTLDYYFLSPLVGWVQVFEGTCTGVKVPVGEQLPAGAEPFRCQSEIRLLKTIDAGQTWMDITP